MASKEVVVDVERNHPATHPSVRNEATREAPVIAPLGRIEFTVEGTERGPPPTYDEAMNPSAAPPPTYDSVIGRVREAHKESSGMVDFLKKVIILLIGTIGCTVVIALTVVIPLGMLLVGSHYFDECPLEPNIPLYLLVGGLFCIFKQFVHFVHRIKSRHNRLDEEETEERGSSLQSLTNCFMLAWFILGSYWVYKEYEPNYNPMKGLYCNQTLYQFAFWQITSVYVLFGFMTMCLCSITLCVLAFARRHLRVPPPDTESHPDERND